MRKTFVIAAMIVLVCFLLLGCTPGKSDAAGDSPENLAAETVADSPENLAADTADDSYEDIAAATYEIPELSTVAELIIDGGDGYVIGGN